MGGFYSRGFGTVSKTGVRELRLQLNLYMKFTFVSTSEYSFACKFCFPLSDVATSTSCSFCCWWCSCYLDLKFTHNWIIIGDLLPCITLPWILNAQTAAWLRASGIFSQNHKFLHVFKKKSLQIFNLCLSVYMSCNLKVTLSFTSII